jgi:hypothetical protein
MISITTAIFFLLPSLFGTAGAAGVWLWIPCAAGVFLIVLVYAHLAARIPITGFAYQWNSRLINPHYGWFTGYTALLAFMAGTATAVALATVFASDIWSSPAHGDIVLFAAVAMAVAAIINIISIRTVSAVNNTGVFFEITGSVGAAALLFFGSIFFHHDAGFKISYFHRTDVAGEPGAARGPHRRPVSVRSRGRRAGVVPAVPAAADRESVGGRLPHGDRGGGGAGRGRVAPGRAVTASCRHRSTNRSRRARRRGRAASTAPAPRPAPPGPGPRSTVRTAQGCADSKAPPRCRCSPAGLG